MMHAIKALETCLPGIITQTATPISCVLDELHRINPIETNEKDINVRKTFNGTPLRYCAHFLNVDAETDVYHTERDCCYTMISVPQQENQSSKKFVFKYKVNDQFVIDVDMAPGVSFTYSAYLLTHQQQRISGNNFFSIAAYANAKFYSSAKQSVIRCNNKKHI